MRARRQDAGAAPRRISSRRCASPGRTAISRNSRRRVDGTLVWPPRGDAGFGYDPMFLPDGQTPHLRRDDERRKARPAAARPRPVAPRPRLPQAGGGVPCQVVEAPALKQADAHRASASTCTGRSACRSARIATSTAMSATPRSTRRASCARSQPRSPRPRRARRAAPSRRIFLGGGTPSLMQPETVGAILDAIGKHWTVAPDVEVTLEANPTSVEATRFRGYRAAGVNRVSLGVQALDDASLKELGRLHTAQEALDAVAIARAIFERYSFDLIYARPRQTPEQWAAELKRAIARSRRASVALSAHHRAGHAVPRAARGRQARHARRRHRARALRHDAGDLRARRPAGLRDFQPRAAGRRVPAQSRLLARARICRHRPRRAWPARHRRPPPRDRDREAARRPG